MDLFWTRLFSCLFCFPFLQSASEKHKINVPETMNEYLDMSDDEGMWHMTQFSLHAPCTQILTTKMKLVNKNKRCLYWNK